jgi:tRNA pseudouridine13 synthase
MFLVPSEGPELEDAVRRADAGELCATGPMFGPKMRQPAGRPAELEAAVMTELLGPVGSWTAPRRLGDGTRRPLVLRATELGWQSDAEQGTSTLRFVLPKGGYATTLLGSVCVLVDAHGGLPAQEEAREGSEI